MMYTTTESNEHNFTLEMLPLYVNDGVDAEQRIRMEQHLQQCNECREESEVMAQLFAGIEDEPTTGESSDIDTDLALARVNARIDAQGADAALNKVSRPQASGLQRMLSKFANFGMTDMGWLGAATAMLVVALVFTNLNPSDDAPYEVLSADPEGAATPSMIVELTLQESISIEQLESHFANIEMAQDMLVVQRGADRYQLQLLGASDVQAVSAILQRSKAVPGYVAAKLVNPDQGNGSN